MKKLALFFVFALLLNVLAGCQGTIGAAGSGAQTHPPVESTPTLPPSAESTAPPETTVPVVNEPASDTGDLLTADEVKKIALEDAGVKESEIRDLDIELDRDSGTIHYDVDFEVDNKDYDYEIDAKTGKILRSETPPKTESQPKDTSSKTESKPKDTGSKTESKPKEETNKELTAAQAREIALKHAKLKSSEVRDLEVELDRDDGKKHFDVSFEKDGYDYEYEVDAKTGKILKSEKERD